MYSYRVFDLGVSSSASIYRGTSYHDPLPQLYPISNCPPSCCTYPHGILVSHTRAHRSDSFPPARGRAQSNIRQPLLHILRTRTPTSRFQVGMHIRAPRRSPRPPRRSLRLPNIRRKEARSLNASRLCDPRSRPRRRLVIT